MAAPDFPLWPFSPNWSGSVTETLTWLTDILTSKTGVEQRRSLLTTPKKQVEYMVLLDKIQRAYADNLLTGKGAHDWMLPLWWDIHYTTTTLQPGGRSIACPTALLGQFKVGGWAVLVAEDPRDHEVFQVASVSATRLVSVDTLKTTWRIGTQIIPIQRARFTDQPQMSRRTDSVSTSSLRFSVIDPNPRDFGIEFVGASLMTDNLLARQYQPQGDGEFDPVAGTCDAQVSFIAALFRAAEALSFQADPLVPVDPASLETADFYRETALACLDTFAGTGDERGPMIRQTISGSPTQIVIPHWLYAARGDVEGRASQGEGYDVIATAGRLRAGFASAAPETFRDIDIALTKAIEIDRRSGKPAFWSDLRRALRRSNLIGRDHTDGREIIKPLPDLPVVPSIGEPTNTSIYSDNPMASSSGKNFFERGINGDIIASIPDSITYEMVLDPDNPDNFPVEDEDGNTPEPANTTIIQPFPTTTTTQYVRYARDRYRTKTFYQNQDYYVFAQLSVNRNLLTNLNERISIGLISGQTVWRANLGSTDLGGDSPKTFLVALERFVTDAGVAIQPGQAIDGFFVQIQAQLAVRLRIRSLRMLSGASAAAVEGNVNAALEGDDIPFRPGANPYRISADVKRQTYIGFVGSPYAGAQRPDLWLLARDEAKIVYNGITVDKLPLINLSNGQTNYPMSARVSSGKLKTPDALLAEQNVIMLDYMQQVYVTHGGKLGPFAHTFVINTEDRFYIGSPQPHSFVYNNVLKTTEVFDQARAVDSMARIAFSATLKQSQIVFNGNPIIYKGDRLVFGKVSADAGRVLSAEETELWKDALDRSRMVANRFLQWYDTFWPTKQRIVFNGNPVIFNTNRVFKEFNEIGQQLKVKNQIPDPRIGEPYYDRPSPYTAAVVLRACLFMKAVDGGLASVYDSLISRCWSYVDAFWSTQGDMAYSWTIDAGNHIQYATWYAEIISTLAEMLNRKVLLTGDIDPAVVRDRLINTRLWITTYGIKSGESATVPGLPDTYRGFSVLMEPPDEARDRSIDVQRLTEDFENPVAFDMQTEYDDGPFNRPQYQWWARGKQGDLDLHKIFYGLRGRAVPIWLPTNMADLFLKSNVSASSYSLSIEEMGYTASGGPRRSRQHILIRLYDGRTFIREIISSALGPNRSETLTLNRPLRQDITVDQVRRISFMDLMRLDQDGIQFEHTTDNSGVTAANTVFRSVKNTRRVRSTAY